MPPHLSKLNWPRTEHAEFAREAATNCFLRAGPEAANRETEFLEMYQRVTESHRSTLARQKRMREEKRAEERRAARRLPAALAELKWPTRGSQKYDAERVFEGYFKRTTAVRDKWYRQQHALSWYHYRNFLETDRAFRKLENEVLAKVGLS